MSEDPKDVLRRYLQAGREAAVWKLDGLSEYDRRRPLVPTGTNVLGLVKHLANLEGGYFGKTFDRPFAGAATFDYDADPNADLWVSEDESSETIVDLYHRACAHADETIAALELDSLGHVPWWPEDRNPVTLQRILVHVIAETHRHAGHADIVRELIDGRVGYRAESANLPDLDSEGWEAHHERVERSARGAGESS
jgi:hypothetical protein